MVCLNEDTTLDGFGEVLLIHILLRKFITNQKFNIFESGKKALAIQ